jgi:Domain of unknown function (DUF5666)
MDRDRVSYPRWVQRGLAALAVVSLVIACGGGVGSGGTGAFASGPITGFGSIVVDQVHFDESSARVEGDAGELRDRGELHLGTMVEVDSGAIRDGAATASQVRIVSALIGSVDAVASGALTVNGVTVRVNAGTVFDDRLVGGVAAITVGAVVEVYGFVNTVSAEIVATRIEPNDNAIEFKFRGVVAALSTQAHTFDLAGQHFTYAGSVSGASQLSNGAFVRVMVSRQRNAQGRWIVTAVGSTAPGGGDRDQAAARGVITAFASNANFAVGGFTVDASSAQIEGGPLAAGLRVEVEGQLQAGVLVARTVSVEDEDEHDPLELRGNIFTVDLSAKVFTLVGRSERVSFARSDIAYQNGDATKLQPGAKVRVVGNPSADGTLVEATAIRFDD